ncbi:MAG: hypothetical protein RL112_120, partial [Planctomycetota bacterium]
MNGGLDVLELALGSTRAANRQRAQASTAAVGREELDAGRLRDVVRFLQLLVDDAQSPDGGRTSLGFDTAR